MSNPSYPVAFNANSSVPVKLWEADGTVKTIGITGAFANGVMQLFFTRDAGTTLENMTDVFTGSVFPVSNLNSPWQIWGKMNGATGTPSVSVYVD